MDSNSRSSLQQIYGPIQSRRLGESLGINLMPATVKICSFDCVYCECGLNDYRIGQMPKQEDIRSELKKKLETLLLENKNIDGITFSGNGEPTMHPDFESIVNAVCELRNTYFPQAKVNVLTNASAIDKLDVYRALCKVDNAILKFDSAIESTMRIIDRPTRTSLSVKWLLKHLEEKYQEKIIIQTMFVRGKYNELLFDNTTDEEITAWIAALKKIKPKQVMIYSLDRKAPIEDIESISANELQTIAAKVKAAGFDVMVAE